MPGRRLLLLLLLLLLAGCRPIVAGKGDDPLLGEWQVARTEGEGRAFFVLTLAPGGTASLFSDGTSKAGTYLVEGDRLTVRVPGYAAQGYAVLRREGGFDLRAEADGTTYVLEDRNGFDAMGLLGPLVLGVAGLALLVPAAGALRVYVCAGAWPEARAEVLDARVEVTRHQRWVGQASAQERASYEVTRDGARGETLRWSSSWPRVTFRYRVGERELVGSNAAHHAHRAGYTPDDAAAQVERWRRDGLSVRFDPRRPETVFLGREHFPLLSTLALTLAGTGLSLGLAAAASQVGRWVNLEPLRVGTVEWPALAVLVALPAYLLLARLFTPPSPRGA